MGRNALQGSGYEDLDLKLSRDIPLAGGPPGVHTVTIGLDALNVLNRVNLTNYAGNVGSPFFKQAVAVQPARQLQLSLRYKF